MSERFPGGVISKTPPEVVPPVDGEGGSASGVWTLDEVLGYEKAGAWPKGILPRELYAWGINTNGRLGDGTTVNRSSPVQVGVPLQWAQVSFRGASLAITTNGALWSWGRNAQGQLGQNDIIDRSSPVQVGALTNWAQVESGASSVLSIKTDGTLWSWGRNAQGQLGDGTTVNRSSPVQIGALTNWAQISIGGSYTTAVAVRTDGRLFAWGSNVAGQLGTNNLINRSSPVQVGALTNWAQVSASVDSTLANNHILAVKTDGTLWAWGSSNLGQLGTGNTIFRSSPVQVGALSNWFKVDTGNRHSGAVKTDGTLWMWGRGHAGQLGDGTVVNKSSPVQVGALTSWAQVSLGGTFSGAVKTDGTLWTWGNNQFGRLGLGDLIFHSSPVQVGALTNWVQLSGASAAVTRG